MGPIPKSLLRSLLLSACFLAADRASAADLTLQAYEAFLKTAPPIGFGLLDSDFTVAREGELTKIPFAYRIRGGGAILVCEPGADGNPLAGTVPGPGPGAANGTGKCNSNDANGISDVLLFPAGQRQLYYVSDSPDGTFTVPLLNGDPCPNGRFPDGLSCTFDKWTNAVFAEYTDPALGTSPYLGFVQEGWAFNEAETDPNRKNVRLADGDVSVYVGTKGSTRAFELYSLVAETTETPEPTPAVLLGTGLILLMLFRFKKAKAARQSLMGRF
jgi:hypothetical protein